MSTQKQLYRVEEDKIFSGVCAGLAEYLNMDVGLVRVLFVLTFILSGFIPVVIVYIVLAVMLPSKRELQFKNNKTKKNDFVNDDDYTINDDDYRY